MRRGVYRLRGAAATCLIMAALPCRGLGEVSGLESVEGGVITVAGDGESAAVVPAPAEPAQPADETPPAEGSGGQPTATDERPPTPDKALPVSDHEPDTSPAVPAGVERGPAARSVARQERVRLKLDVEGEIFATVGSDVPPLRLPTKLEARFDFRESPATGADAFCVERRYTDAAADLTVDGESRRSTLAADARVVRFTMLGTTPTPFLASGHLTREELDLLETPFDPLLASAISPPAAVTENESWVIAADATAGLLAIDTVESGQLEARLTGVVDAVATVTITGIVDGAVDGVPTHVVVEGICTMPAADAAGEAFSLDRPPQSATVTIRERREAGHVSPGFDVDVRVSFAREPATEDSANDAPADHSPVRRGGPGTPGLVWHRDSRGRFEIVHDGRWKMIEDGLDGLVMRLVDRGALVAQCSVTGLSRGPADSPPTIAAVERDLQRSLAGQATVIEHSSEASRSDGIGIVRVVATGRVGDVPFRWIHAVLTDVAGHRIAVTCMLEAALRERFGEADRELVDGISLPAAAGTARDGATGPIEREARLPSDSPPP